MHETNDPARLGRDVERLSAKIDLLTAQQLDWRIKLAEDISALNVRVSALWAGVAAVGLLTIGAIVSKWSGR